MKLDLDPDNLTLGDMEDFEAVAGRGLTEAMEDYKAGTISMKEVVGLVWICGRAANPAFTLDDARRLKVTDLEVEVAEPDPTPGGV